MKLKNLHEAVHHTGPDDYNMIDLIVQYIEKNTKGLRAHIVPSSIIGTGGEKIIVSAKGEDWKHTNYPPSEYFRKPRTSRLLSTVVPKTPFVSILLYGDGQVFMNYVSMVVSHSKTVSIYEPDSLQRIVKFIVQAYEYPT